MFGYRRMGTHVWEKISGHIMFWCRCCGTDIQVYMSGYRCLGTDIPLQMSRYICSATYVQVQMSGCRCPGTDIQVQIYQHRCLGKMFEYRSLDTVVLVQMSGYIYPGTDVWDRCSTKHGTLEYESEWWGNHLIVVKLQAKSWVDFALPLSQQEKQEPPPKSIGSGCTRGVKFYT